MDKEIKKIFLNTDLNDVFKSLFDSLNFEDRLSYNIFEIIKKYISYDVAGIFFNESNESVRNVLNLSLPNNNISIKLVDKIRDRLFDKVEKYKRVNEIQCNLIGGGGVGKSNITISKLKTFEIIMFKYSENLTGGLILCSTKKLKKSEINYLEIIKNELNVVYKVKYIINEQKKNALKDSMTGLYSRQEFDNMIDLEFNKARRYIYNFTLAMIDIDYLSKINDKYGRDFGDFVISELSILLKNTFRKTDPIFRYGSEEIIIYLPFTPITKALIPIERLRTAISGYTFEKDNKKTNITVSVGLCANYSKFTEPEQMLEGLGISLLRAKERGRNKVDIFE